MKYLKALQIIFVITISILQDDNVTIDKLTQVQNLLQRMIRDVKEKSCGKLKKKGFNMIVYLNET